MGHIFQRSSVSLSGFVEPCPSPYLLADTSEIENTKQINEAGEFARKFQFHYFPIIYRVIVIVSYCIVLYRIVSYCIVLYCYCIISVETPSIFRDVIAPRKQSTIEPGLPLTFRM